MRERGFSVETLLPTLKKTLNPFQSINRFLHCHIEPHLGVGLGMVLNSLLTG